jgi:hypothetical protein
MMLANRRRNRDRRRPERRQRNIPVPTEHRSGQERRSGERRQQDLFPLANRLYAEVEKVPADNPILRLLVVQQFLLDRRPRQDNAWIMKWARELRDAYDDGDCERMWSAMSGALSGSLAQQTLGDR